MKHAMDMIVSFSGSNPVISQSMKTKGSLERILANLGFVLGFESHARAFGKNRDFRKEKIIILFANTVTKSMHRNWRKMFEDWRASGKTSLESVDEALILTVYESSEGRVLGQLG